MLRELRVRNLALIEEARLHFGPGLNALTGETGAGKTVLVEALDLLLGGRGDSGLIKAGAEKLELEASFEIEDNEPARMIAEGEGFEVDGELILRRIIGSDGKSRCYVNGRMSTVSSLSRLGERLVDIHGQHEHQRLLHPSSHLEYLDAYGDAAHQDLLRKYRLSWESWKEAKDKLELFTMAEADRLREMDLLAFQVKEIEAVRPLSGEMEELLRERKRMQNREELFNSASAAYISIAGDDGEGGVLDGLGRAEGAVARASLLDETLADLVPALRDCQERLAEAAACLRSYGETLEFEPGRLDAVEARLHALNDLARKYGRDTDEILDHLARSKARLEQLSNLDRSQDEAKAEIAELRARLETYGGALSESRRRLAEKLMKETNRELKDMNMAGMRFRIEIDRSREFAAEGGDSVEFTVSPGKEVPFRPLARIASGGELSRIMLALKIALARADAVPTLVFDELDSGIGGRTADVLAEKLRLIGDYHQVLSITHLPQVAAISGTHLSIRKEAGSKGVTTSVELLDSQRRVEELTRMLGGDEATARKHALSMLKKKT
jgi:DNA repair protein RecN (Recombination protein N)